MVAHAGFMVIVVRVYSFPPRLCGSYSAEVSHTAGMFPSAITPTGNIEGAGATFLVLVAADTSTLGDFAGESLIGRARWPNHNGSLQENAWPCSTTLIARDNWEKEGNP
jgi:hypothetical protein